MCRVASMLTIFACVLDCGGGACPSQMPLSPAPAPAAGSSEPQHLLILDRYPNEQAVGEAGWILSGGARDAYVVRRDTPGGRSAWLLEPIRDTFGSYGTWMRQVDAGEYRGKRGRITAIVRTQGATRRVDVGGRAQTKDRPAGGRRPGRSGGKRPPAPTR